MSHKRIDETMIYVHMAENHRREIPACVLEPGMVRRIPIGGCSRCSGLVAKIYQDQHLRKQDGCRSSRFTGGYWGDRTLCRRAYLRREGATLGVGYEFAPEDLRTERVVAAGYSIVAVPHEAGTLKLLEVWTCPSCETEQCAMVEIEGRCIVRIGAVTMNRATLESANFISTANAELLAASLMGISPMEYAERKLDSLTVLRERLE